MSSKRSLYLAFSGCASLCFFVAGCALLAVIVRASPQLIQRNVYNASTLGLFVLVAGGSVGFLWIFGAMAAFVFNSVRKTPEGKL